MRRILFLLLLVFFPCIGQGKALSFPVHTPPVTDEAGVLDNQTEQNLSRLVKQIPHYQLEIATLSSSRGLELADYGYQLGRYWGVGEKGLDNGILLLIVPSQHEVRIETGYGAEQALTDAQAKLLIEQEMIPFFKEANIQSGVLNGTEKLAQLLQDSAPVQRQQRVKDAPPNPLYIVAGGILLLLILILFLIKKGKTYSLQLQNKPRQKPNYYKQWLESVKKTGKTPSNPTENAPDAIQLQPKRSKWQSPPSASPRRNAGGSFGGGGAEGKW